MCASGDEPAAPDPKRQRLPSVVAAAAGSRGELDRELEATHGDGAYQEYELNPDQRRRARAFTSRVVRVREFSDYYFSSGRRVRDASGSLGAGFGFASLSLGQEEPIGQRGDVLELGAGIGLAGLAAASTRAPRRPHGQRWRGEPLLLPQPARTTPAMSDDSSQRTGRSLRRSRSRSSNWPTCPPIPSRTRARHPRRRFWLPQRRLPRAAPSPGSSARFARC